MAVPVDIYVKDNTPFTDPISGVFVSVLNPSTFAIVATAITDGTGRAAFSLPGAVSPGTLYEARFFKLGVTFANPKQIAVEEPAVTTNKFDMSGTLLVLPVATDPRVCRCSGRFMSFSNTPIARATVRFMARAESGYQVPKVVDGNMVSAEAYSAQTDADGFVSVDLIRGAQYFITFSGEDDVIWSFCVPDRSSANLIELIHPQPVLLTWDPTEAPGNAVSVPVGQTKVIPFTLSYSNYEVLASGSSKWVTFTNSDDTFMDVGYSDGQVSITAKAVGVANVSTEILPNLKPVRVPDYNVIAPLLVVTVTP